jgi:hypothetical protein
MKIIDAKTMSQVGVDQLSHMLASEYAALWVSKYGSEPKGMHPIPSNVAQDEVHFYIDFD